MDVIIRTRLLLIIYLLTIFYALNYGIPLYATSSYLSKYFSSGNISLIYMLGSVATLFFALHFTAYLHKYHTYKFISLVLITDILSTFGFCFSDNIIIVGIFFVIHLCLSAIIYSILSIFLEMLTPHQEMGIARGLFSMIIGLCLIISPLIGSMIITFAGYKTMFIFSTLILVPFIILLKRYFFHLAEPTYRGLNTFKITKVAWKNKNLRGIMIGIFLVQSFYATMIIYLPLYLTGLGVPLSSYLSFIIPVSLIPFILLPYEIGFLADTKWGEKEMLIFGLIILSIATLSIAIITSTSLLVWVSILLVARVGAVFVDTMTATYFYKKIHKEDASLVMISSSMIPAIATIVVGFLGIILSPIISSYPGIIFILLGTMFLFGVSYILPIKDTK